jgi:hypothetical protein
MVRVKPIPATMVTAEEMRVILSGMLSAVPTIQAAPRAVLQAALRPRLPAVLHRPVHREAVAVTLAQEDSKLRL